MGGYLALFASLFPLFNIDCSLLEVNQELTWKVCMLIESHIFNLCLEWGLISFGPQRSISKSNTSLLNRRLGNRADWFKHFCLFFTQAFIPIDYTLIPFQIRDFDFVVVPILFLDELWWYGMCIMT